MFEFFLSGLIILVMIIWIKLLFRFILSVFCSGLVFLKYFLVNFVDKMIVLGLLRVEFWFLVSIGKLNIFRKFVLLKLMVFLLSILFFWMILLLLVRWLYCWIIGIFFVKIWFKGIEVIVFVLFFCLVFVLMVVWYSW